MKGILWAVPKINLDVAEVFEIPASHIHCTLGFGVNKDEVKGLIGKEFTAKIVGNSFDSEIQALELELPESIPCGNPIPHISVSMISGVKPVKSNTMLNKKFGITTEVLSVEIPMSIEFFEFN